VSGILAVCLACFFPLMKVRMYRHDVPDSFFLSKAGNIFLSESRASEALRPGWQVSMGEYPNMKTGWSHDQPASIADYTKTL